MACNFPRIHSNCEFTGAFQVTVAFKFSLAWLWMVWRVLWHSLPFSSKLAQAPSSCIPASPLQTRVIIISLQYAHKFSTPYQSFLISWLCLSLLTKMIDCRSSTRFTLLTRTVHSVGQHKELHRFLRCFVSVTLYKVGTIRAQKGRAKGPLIIFA